MLFANNLACSSTNIDYAREKELEFNERITLKDSRGIKSELNRRVVCGGTTCRANSFCFYDVVKVISKAQTSARATTFGAIELAYSRAHDIEKTYQKIYEREKRYGEHGE